MILITQRVLKIFNVVNNIITGRDMAAGRGVSLVYPFVRVQSGFFFKLTLVFLKCFFIIMIFSHYKTTFLKQSIFLLFYIVNIFFTVLLF